VRYGSRADHRFRSSIRVRFGCRLLYRWIPVGVTMERHVLEKLLAGDDEASVAAPAVLPAHVP
jgi:hypothetical protein